MPSNQSHRGRTSNARHRSTRSRWSPQSGAYNTSSAHYTALGCGSSPFNDPQLAHVGGQFNAHHVPAVGHHSYTTNRSPRFTGSYGSAITQHQSTTPITGQCHIALNHPYDATTAGTSASASPSGYYPSQNSAVHTTTCSYHKPLLQLQTHTPIYASTISHDPLSRFLAEGPSEQSALYIQSDNGNTSLTRNCTCGHPMQGYGYQLELFDETEDREDSNSNKNNNNHNHNHNSG
ncbi:hypothetical protein MPH_03265 [Macrophomina phaseolina MS6]|uniref:Uncharacterized protein n=1 Tax=Macrophomina phaseolina (strain MS6) TaxID=1126212 RepID=K2S2Z1_MACPH|nr:hypothetical protein MPH_03265 [Macrophomina phaseolina MS6]